MKEKLSKKQARILDDLKQRYTKGEITSEDLSDLMEIEIAAELAKEDNEIDHAWLDACGNLFEMAEQESSMQQPNAEQNDWAEIQQKLHLVDNRLRHAAMRVIAMAAGVILLFFVGSTLQKWSWVESNHSEDEQTYYLEGKQNSIPINSTAKAGLVSTPTVEYSSTDINQIAKVLGYTPQVPSWIPDDWTLLEYNVSISTSLSEFEAVYGLNGEKRLLSYGSTTYLQLDEMATAIQQDEKGESITLDDGRSLYVTMNMGRPSLTWIVETTVYHLYGPISMEDAVKIASEIK